MTFFLKTGFAAAAARCILWRCNDCLGPHGNPASAARRAGFAGARGAGGLCPQAGLVGQHDSAVAAGGAAHQPGRGVGSAQRHEQSLAEPLEGWRVVGPFDDAKGVGMDVALPPEKVVSKAAMPGKGGKRSSGEEWKAGRSCPLAAEMKDSIAPVPSCAHRRRPRTRGCCSRGPGVSRSGSTANPRSRTAAPRDRSGGIRFCSRHVPDSCQAGGPCRQMVISAYAGAISAGTGRDPLRTLVAQRWPEATNESSATASSSRGSIRSTTRPTSVSGCRACSRSRRAPHSSRPWRLRGMTWWRDARRWRWR